MNASAQPPVLHAERIGKSYPAFSPGTPGLELFHELDLAVSPGEMVAVVGQSGAGKSTLLHLLAALDRVSAGNIWCGGVHVSSLAPEAAAAYRNRHIGYVWQAHHLLPEFTALENVAMPLLAREMRRRDALAEAATWLGRVGLANRSTHRAGELSGGEQQRVSVARALVTRPKVLLADEPTGNLDAMNADAVFALLQALHRAEGLGSVVVTHNVEFARRCDRVLRLQSGKLQHADV